MEKMTPDQLAPSPTGRRVTDGRTGPLAGGPPLQNWGRRRVRGEGDPAVWDQPFACSGWEPWLATQPQPLPGAPSWPWAEPGCPGHSPACRDAGSSSRGSSRDRPIALLSSREMRGQAQTSRPEGTPSRALGAASGKSGQQDRDNQAPSEDTGRVGAFPSPVAPEWPALPLLIWLLLFLYCKRGSPVVSADSHDIGPQPPCSHRGTWSCPGLAGASPLPPQPPASASALLISSGVSLHLSQSLTLSLLVCFSECLSASVSLSNPR